MRLKGGDGKNTIKGGAGADYIYGGSKMMSSPVVLMVPLARFPEHLPVAKCHRWWYSRQRQHCWWNGRRFHPNEQRPNKQDTIPVVLVPTLVLKDMTQLRSDRDVTLIGTTLKCCNRHYPEDSTIADSGTLIATPLAVGNDKAIKSALQLKPAPLLPVLSISLVLRVPTLSKQELVMTPSRCWWL